MMHIKRITSVVGNYLRLPFYQIYQYRMSKMAMYWDKPNHIGIILDGNRRYAMSTGLSNIIWGHIHGADKLVDVLRWCFEFKIKVVTIWIFSLDNFNRAEEEVTSLLKLIEDKTREYTENDDIHNNRVRVQYIGRLELLPASLRNAIDGIEERTKAYDNFFLNVAIAYGGREEILDACRSFLQEESDNGSPLSEVLDKLTPEAIDSYLYTSGFPDPDLIIRTSGEVRLSGFLLWQSAYSEFYFCDTYWPQFRKIDFLRAIRAYSLRKRRYGR